MIEDNRHFGSILKEAREKSGFDVGTLARRLHIRADILMTIEDSDFKNMPASGYARNMIRSYARTVGLNQNEICSLYLNQLKQYENATSSAGSFEVIESRNSSRRASEQYRNTSRSGNRRTYTEDRRYNNRTPDYNSEKYSRGNASNSQRSSSRSRDRSSRNKERTTRSMSTTPNLGKMPLLKSASIQNINKQSVIAILSVAIILILIIVICVMLFGPKKSDVDELPTMPISGLTDTSNKSVDVGSNTETRQVTKATFEFTVESGAQSWITVVNGEETVYAGVASGETKSFDCTTTLTFSTANPTPVTCKVNGKEVELTKSGNYYIYELDFAKYKAEVEGSNSSSSSSTDSTSASSAGDSSNASSTSSSSNSSTNSTSSSSTNNSGSTSRNTSNTTSSSRQNSQ